MKYDKVNNKARKMLFDSLAEIEEDLKNGIKNTDTYILARDKANISDFPSYEMWSNS